MQRLHIQVQAKTTQYAVAAVGTFHGHRFIGIFGGWFPLPALPALPALPQPTPLGASAPAIVQTLHSWADAVCASTPGHGTGGGSFYAPHELLMGVCVLVFVMLRAGVLVERSITLHVSWNALRKGKARHCCPRQNNTMPVQPRHTARSTATHCLFNPHALFHQGWFSSQVCSSM